MFLNLLVRLGLAEVITGTQGSIYLVRIRLTPMTPWGQLLLHKFYRGDEDPDPHDHHWRFSTLPLNQDYLEEVMQHDGSMKANLVPRWRWTRRCWAHCHRILPVGNKFPLWTLVWRGPDIPGLTWGFWVDTSDPNSQIYGDLIGWYYQSNPVAGPRQKIPWRTYLFKEQQKEHI